MKFLEYFKKEKNNKKDFIENIINDEVNKSNKFGLFINKNDIEKEKEIFVKIFTHFWDLINDKSLSNNKYSELMNGIFEIVYEQLGDQVIYYNEKTKNEQVKNMYNCHISSVIHTLFLKINNI